MNIGNLGIVVRKLEGLNGLNSDQKKNVIDAIDLIKNEIAIESKK